MSGRGNKQGKNNQGGNQGKNNQGGNQGKNNQGGNQGKNNQGDNQEIKDTISFICRNDRPECTQCSYILDKNVEKEQNKDEKMFTGKVYEGTSNGLTECNKFCPKNPLPDGKPCPNDGDDNTKTRTDSDMDESPPPNPKSGSPNPKNNGNDDSDIIDILGDYVKNIFNSITGSSSVGKKVVLGILISIVILLILRTIFSLF
jgi:hypothetical protein